MNPLLRSASLLVLVSLALSASAQNLVVNPGFETGDLTGYTVTGQTSSVSVFVANGGRFGAGSIDEGMYSAFFGAKTTPASISQTLATTPGTRYLVSFDLRSGVDLPGFVDNTPSSFVARFGGATLLSLTDPAVSSGFTTYSFSVVGSGSDELVFTGRNDPNAFILDEIRVTPAPVPEPATLAALGLGASALLRRRRRSA